MTEYNRLFADAFDRITPASDDADFIRGIIERADKMEKENKNTGVYRVESRPGDQIQYKPKKAPIIAGVAAITAAAAGIGFFAGGGSFGNFEFVPLKEGGGAGYSANAEAAGEVTTNALLETLVEPEVTDHYMQDEYYEFRDYTVHITGYEFNTVFLRLYYDVTPKPGVGPIDNENDRPFIWSSGSDYTVTAYRQTGSSGDTASCMVDIIPAEPTHKLDVRFEASETGETVLYTAECGSWNYVFRIPCDVEGADPRVSELFISQSEVIMKYGLSDSDEPLPSVEVYNTANIPVSFADSSYNAADMTNNIGYAFRGFAELCDTSDIGRVYLGNVLVYERESMMNGDDAVVTSAYAPGDVPESYGTTHTAAWDDTLPQPENRVETTALHDITPGSVWKNNEMLPFASGRNVIMTGYEYDGRILKINLTGDISGARAEDGNILIRSSTDPRDLMLGIFSKDNKNYTLTAVLDVPAGKTDIIEFVNTGVRHDDGDFEVGGTLAVRGTDDYDPLMERVGVDMTDYGIPGTTLDRMTLSPLGLELSFTGTTDWTNDFGTLDVEYTTLNGTVVTSEKAEFGMSFKAEMESTYDIPQGIYHITAVIMPREDMIDLTQMKEFSVNGLKFKRAEFMAMSSWDDLKDMMNGDKVDLLANFERLVNSSEQIEELKQLLLKIEGVTDVQVYNNDDDPHNTDIQITEGKAEKGMVVKVFYDNGESWVQYTKQ